MANDDLQALQRDDHHPGWTAVGVTGPAAPGLLVEIRAVAVLGSGSAADEQRS